jgi:hypothetical protein
LHYKNIKVINFKKTKELDLSKDEFLSIYQKRQKGIIKRINSISKYIEKNKIYFPEDINEKTKPFLKKFIKDLDIFLSDTYYTTLNVKKLEEELYYDLSQKYPYLKEGLITLSSGASISTLRLMKEAEFAFGENDEFVHLFCGGNKKLAKKIANKEIDYEHIKKMIDEIERKKKLKRISSPLDKKIKLLDRLLITDNVTEHWIWKASWFTAPIWHIYNIIQESINPTGKIIKDKYIFDIELITRAL